jgi:hypothetical protein
MHVAKQRAGPGDCKSAMHLQPCQTFQRENPTAEGNFAARHPRARTGNGQGNAMRRRFANGRRDTRLIGRHDDALGVAAKAGSVLQVMRSYTSRITGMISGRRAVDFTM